MKFLLVVLSVLGVALTHPSLSEKEVKSVEDDIAKVILDIVAQLPDPLVLADQDINLPENDLINGEIDIKSLLVEGLSTLQITAIKFHTLTLTLDISVLYERLGGNGEFVNDVVVTRTDTPTVIQDNPSGDVAVTGIKLDITIQISLGVPIQVKSLHFVPDIDTANVDLHGLRNDDELSQQITDEINNNGAQWIHDNAEAINDVVSPIIVDVVNKILAGQTKETERLQSLINRLL